MSTDRFQCVVLCEDDTHYRFVRGFVSKRHTGARFVRRSAPPGSGSGRAYVEHQLHREARETGRRASRARTRLIAVVDGDGDTFSDALRRLEERSYEGILQEPHVLVVVARRNIETWIAFAYDRTVDEEKDYKSEVSRELNPKRAGELLAETFNRATKDCSELPALQAARQRYQTVFEHV